MSIRLMTRVWDEAPYDGAQLLVLLALADISNDEGKSWPSIGLMSKRARCSTRWCRATITEFVKDGWVTREERRGHSSVYYLHPPPRN